MMKHGFFLRMTCQVLLCLQFFRVTVALQLRVPSTNHCVVRERSTGNPLSVHSPPMTGFPVASIGAKARTMQTSTTRLFEKQQTDSDEVVEVGTKEYYSGFLSSPIQDETVAERGSGLEQALKLAGGVVAVLVLLVAGFMASNGLL